MMVVIRRVEFQRDDRAGHCTGWKATLRDREEEALGLCSAERWDTDSVRMKV